MKKIVAFIAVLIYMTCAGTVWGQITSGTSYYLRNRQAGTFLTGGNRWGTQTVLHETGIDFEVTLSNGKYLFDSKVNQAGKRYLGNTGFVNVGQATGVTDFSLNQIEGKYYTISIDGKNKFLSAPSTGVIAAFSGDKADNTAAHWEFLTRDQLIGELKDKASISNPMNATFLIPGFDFNIHDTRNANWQGDPNIDGYDDEDPDNKDDAKDFYKRCAEKWNTTIDVYQDLTGLPNGLYKLSVQGFYRAGGVGSTGTERNAYLYANTYANTATTPLMNINAESGTVPINQKSACDAFVKDLYSDNSVFVIVTDGTLRVGIKKEELITSDWTCFDNFQLTYYGNPTLYTASTGTYYLQNVATGEYLQGGMVHGTDVAMGNGIPFELVKRFDGVYQIRSGIGKSGSDYLCDEGRLSHAPTDFLIVQASNGIYNIVTTNTGCNGSDITSGRMLTAGVVDLNSLNFVEWSQSNPGGSIVKDWDYVNSFLHNRYLPNHEYKTGDGLVYGTWDVNPNCYTDLTGYGTMTIRGAAGSVIRVLLNGKVQDANDYTEITCTIGSNGVSTIDLSGYGHVHLNAIKVPDGNTAIIESITLSKDVSLSNMKFVLWSQATPGGAIQDASPENFKNNMGTSTSLNEGGIVYGDAGVYPQNYADLTGYKSMTIKATPKSVFRVLFNRAGTNTALGDLVEKTVTIGDNGLGYLDFSDLSYAHLNAIKIAWGSIASTVESIMLSNQTSFVVNSSDNEWSQWKIETKAQRISNLAGAKEDAPKDATFLIDNAALTIDDATLGTSWSGIESADWGPKEDYKNNCVEKFNKTTFDAYQTISGLPAGVYELTVQGYYRSGNTAIAAGKTNDGTDILRPFLYVKQEGKLIGQAPLQSIFDGGVDNKTDGFSTSANGEWLPNSLSDAAKVFVNGHYGANGEYNKVRFVVPSDGATVQIGVKKNTHYDNDWAAFDNFRLTYLGLPQNGESQTVYSYELGETWGTFYLKNAETGTYLTAGGTDGVSAVLGDQMHQHSVYNNEAKYQKGVRETDFTFVAVGADKFVIETGIGEGYLTRDNGVKLNGKLESSKAILTLRKNDNGNYYIFHNSDAERFLRYADNELYWGTSQSTTPGDNFQWIFQTKEDLLAEFPSATESNPIDATFLLRGTAFHKDDSRNSAWTGKPVVGGAESNYVGSASGRTFDISQKLTGVPNGVYEFTLQGYYITEGDALNTDVKYYTSTDGRTFTFEHIIKVWEIDFIDGEIKVQSDIDPTYINVGETSYVNVVINENQLNHNFVSADNLTWLMRPNGLYQFSGGARSLGINNLFKGQVVKIKTDNINAFHSFNDVWEIDQERTTDNELVLRVVKNGDARMSMERYYYIRNIAVYDESNLSTTYVSSMNDASTVFASGQGTHPVIRFKVENKTIIAGVYNTIKTDNASLYIDNVRLTYLGENVTDGIATPQKIARGIRHKRSRYYDLAAENGHLTFDDYNTVNEASNKTTLSNETMVKLNKNSNIMIQHTPVYRNTIYARAGETLEIVLPSSYTDKAQSSGKYYQRLYNYKTDDMFVEDAANVGVFDLAGSNQGTAYSDADIRKKMEVYEGSMSAPAGGWVFGNRWGQQLVSKFNFTTPTSTNKFSTLDHAIEIAVDYTDLTDVGDMGMFGDLTEPTLVQRAIFVIVPAQVMVDKLNACTGETFLEVKSISFPSIWHGLNTNDLNAVALDMQVRNYFSADADVTLDDIVITLTGNGTGITLDGGTTQADGSQTKTFASLDDRFIKFKYPDGGTVTNLVTEYIYVKTTSGKNIAKFILDFVPDTELRPWKDIMGQATLSRSPMYLDNHAQLIDVLNFDKSYRKEGGEAVYHPGTWPIGDDTSINGIERDTVVKNPSQFNPYPLDFEQTTFGAYYPRAIWSQYSVMKRLHSYRDKPEFKDVNQLYHDYFNTQDGTGDLLQKYQGGGYFMYIDASNFPSSIARLTMEEKLCEGTTIHFSGWVSSMDLSTDGGNAPGYLLFSIVGIDGNGNETVIESFCPGPIRADGKSYAGETVKYDTYHTEIGWTDSYSIWQQFAFSFVIKADVASKYEEYALKIDNYCSSTSGGDMMVDDVRLYIHKAVPEVMQETPICEVGRMNNMKVSAKFDELVSSVNKSRENDESAAYEKYTTASGNQKFIPSAWYCFLDKQTYDGVLKSDNTANREKNAFNAALVTQGGNYGTGFYKFDFSTCFESNDKGNDSRTNGSDPYKYEYDALAEEVINPNGEVAEERVYLNPIESQLLAGETSLRDMAYYLKSGDKWITATPGWVINVETTTVYGDGNNIERVDRYTDVSGYEELRIYQTNKTNIRCFFINKAGTGVETVSSASNNMDYNENKGAYHAINLTEIKNACGGNARLICIKGPDGSTLITASDITLYKSSAVLVPDKKYYIVFHATADGSIPDLSKPDEFFMMNSEINKTCAAIDSFSLASGSIIRINGSLSSDNSSYCAGQIATLKVELQGVNKNRAVMQEDRFYDWWLGDKESLKTANNGEGLYAYQVLENFRAAYPEEDYDNQDPIDGVFTETDKTYLKKLITPQINDEGKYEPARLYLYQSSLNVRVTDKDSDGQMHITVIPVDAQLAEANYCDPIQVSMVVSGNAPTAKDGFEGISYLSYLNEVPLRIGLEQVKSVTDGAKDSWGSDDKVLYVPLRDIAFSGTTGFSNGFKKVNHKDMEIAAVFLAETNDPEMISYDVNQEGDKEMRYVGKVRTFAAATGRNKFEDYVKLTFNPGFTPKEGYRYTLKTSFVETNADGNASTCHGDLLIPLYIVPEYQVWVGGPDGNWANDDNWRRADNGELKFTTTDRPTNKANTTSQGFVPMDFTKVLMQSNSVAKLNSVTKDGDLVKFSDTDGHTPDIQYHLAAKNDAPWVSSMRETDIYCEPFYTNTAKEVHFEPYSQMLNTQYLTYERAWVEYALESGRWYTLSSPLQGVVSGDMYLPRGTAKQESPYFDPITYNNTDYTRLAPAVYQQAWDKAEATLYRLERDQLDNYRLPDWERNTATANVAQALDWSYEYNDVKVPFGVNGFSVKVDVSRIEGYSKEEGAKDVLLRLPKADKTYNYYMYDDNTNGSQTVDLTTTQVNGKNLRENAGKLFTDGMPAEGMTVTLTNNSADNPYFLVGNPFMSGLDLDKFFAENTGLLDKKYWILTKDSYSAGIKDGEEQWASTDEFTTGNVAPLQAFFVKKIDGKGGTLNVKFTSGMAVQLAEDALQTRASGAPATLRLTAMRDGVESRAIVVCREEATEGFCAGEDVEALFDSNLSHAPTLYTAAGEVAAAINVRRTLHGVPVGIGGEDETEVTLTFDGVEQFGEELYLYDAAEGTSTLIPASGTSLSVCGRTTGRYYLVTTPLDGSAQESVPVVSVQGRVVTVLSAFDEIEAVEAFDAMGCRVYADGAVGSRTRFTLPAQGVYLITVKTAAGVFCHKVLVNS